MSELQEKLPMFQFGPANYNGLTSGSEASTSVISTPREPLTPGSNAPGPSEAPKTSGISPINAATATVVPSSSTNQGASNSAATATSAQPAPVNVTSRAPLNVTTNYRQLEHLVNKWIQDVDDQEKEFIKLTTESNFYDRTVFKNAEKVTQLHGMMENIKRDQFRMENVLHNVKDVQADIESYIVSLENSLPTQAPNTAPQERKKLFDLAENLDNELNQMSSDMKEIIQHINHNSRVGNSDPISQVVRVLNEHTDALQWIEDKSNVLRLTLEHVAKGHRECRKDHELAMCLMFQHQSLK